MAGPCDDVVVWLERQRLPLYGGADTVAAPACTPLHCCDLTAANLADTCDSLQRGSGGASSATGSGSASGGSQLVGTVETRRLYLPPGLVLGEELPDQVTEECCGVVSGSASANARLPDQGPADPACVVTVKRRRVYLPPWIQLESPVCVESPPCCPVFEPCAACPDPGLPNRFFVTLLNVIGAECLDGISIPLAFFAPGVWGTGVPVFIGNLICCGETLADVWVNAGAQCALDSPSVLFLEMSIYTTDPNSGELSECVDSEIAMGHTVIDCATVTGLSDEVGFDQYEMSCSDGGKPCVLKGLCCLGRITPPAPFPALIRFAVSP